MFFRCGLRVAATAASSVACFAVAKSRGERAALVFIVAAFAAASTAEIVWDTIIHVRVVRRLRSWREKLASFAATTMLEASSIGLLETVVTVDCPADAAGWRGWWAMLQLNVVTETRRVDDAFSAFVAYCTRISAFIPLPARVQADKRSQFGSASPGNASGSLIQFLPAESSSVLGGNASFSGGRSVAGFNQSITAPPTSPVPKVGSPALPEQSCQDAHIQLLLDAIRNAAATLHVPQAPKSIMELSMSPGSVHGQALESSPTAVYRANVSMTPASPVSPSKRSNVSSPKLSPQGTGHRITKRGTFRPSERVAEASVEHNGTVLAVDILLPKANRASGDFLPQQEVVVPVSDAIGQAINILVEYGGVVSYFDLSRIIATFHVQQPCVDHARCAVFAGLAVSHLLEALAEDDVTFGVGISTGSLLAGDLGTDQLRSCVVYGRAVIEAIDLAKLNYNLQTRVLLSEALHDVIQGAGVVTMLVDFVSIEDAAPTVVSLSPDLRSPLAGAIPSVRDNSDVTHSPPANPQPAVRSIAVFEARGADNASFDESFTDPNFAPAPQHPHDVQVAYLEAFFYMRKGQYCQAVMRLSSIAPDILEGDIQLQRILRIAVYLKDLPHPPSAYLRSKFQRWEALETICDQHAATRQASPSFAGKRAARLSYESPTRIIEAVMRARSVTPALPGLMSPHSNMGLHGGDVHTPHHNSNPLDSSHTALDGTCNLLGMSLTVSSEFADVSGVLWRKSEKLLGKGAFGEVFLGMRVDDGKLVAMKQLKIPEIVSASAATTRMRRTQQREKQELEALVREIKMLCQLRHPNIVFFLGCGVVSHDILINLEYVSGGSLQSILEEFGCIPLQAAQRYLKDILRGLDFLHGKGIIHRDLKPGNVLLHVDGGCKVTDFGTSIQIQNILDNNIVVGTPAYMSPEQAKGSHYTCLQSDLWSVGIMAIQLLTGTLPIAIQTAAEAHQHMRRLATDESFTVPIPVEALHPAAVPFVSQCLRRDATSRGTAHELLLHPFLFTATQPTPMRQKGSSTFSQSPHSSDAGSLSPIQPPLSEGAPLSVEATGSHRE